MLLAFVSLPAGALCCLRLFMLVEPVKSSLQLPALNLSFLQNRYPQALSGCLSVQAFSLSKAYTPSAFPKIGSTLNASSWFFQKWYICRTAIENTIREVKSLQNSCREV